MVADYIVSFIEFVLRGNNFGIFSLLLYISVMIAIPTVIGAMILHKTKKMKPIFQQYISVGVIFLMICVISPAIVAVHKYDNKFIKCEATELSPVKILGDESIPVVTLCQTRYNTYDEFGELEVREIELKKGNQ